MERLTNGQRLTLEALCRTIVPAAFDDDATADLPAHVESRISDLSPFHQRRSRLALNLFGSRSLSLLVIGQARPFGQLAESARSHMLTRCAEHPLGAVRLLFGSVRRLIVHAHYGRPEAQPVRAARYRWEGPLPGAEPVVSPAARERVLQRTLPDRVFDAAAPGAPGSMRARICVIGSGVGGATAAAILAEAGHDVVVLEEGGFYRAADFSDNETRALRTLYADGGLRCTDALSVSILQARCAGGGSTINWMVMLRTPEWVIDEWQRHGTEGMGRAEMSAAFDQFERDSSVHVVPDAAHSPANRLILDGAARLGWSAHAAAINARGCMRIGQCGFGCPHDAKQGALLTYLPRALRAGARLVCHAAARRISRQGTSYTVHTDHLDVVADIVIVAAGAVATPALLQTSGFTTPAIGRNLRLHPTTSVVGVYEQPMYAAAGIPLTTYCDEFVRLRGGHGHWIETAPLSAGLAAVALPGFGALHRSYMQQFEYLAPLIVLVRDGAPGGASAGSVAATRKHASIRYRLGSSDRESLLHGMESAARIHFACGARSVLTLHGRETVMRDDSELSRIRSTNARIGDPTLFSAHVNGTARLGADRRTSGCTPSGQVHGQPGLYVMDGSLLPSAPGVNPHETIAAVSLILAQRLARALK